MSEHALRAAIAAFPDEDTPRLVYADWLDENGNPERAEFIRLQIELERIPNDATHRVDILRREAELFADFAEDWAGQELPEGITAQLADTDYTGRSPAFRRGMPERIATTLHALQSNGEGLVHLSPVELHVEWLERDKAGNRRPETILARVELLAACPALAHLTRLHLKYNRIGPAGLERILCSPHLAPLREFSVGPDQYGETGANLLANCERLSDLRSLDVGSCRVGTAGLACLLASPFLRAVEEMDLNGSELDDDAFTRLARHEPMQNWRVLDLSYNESGQRGVRELLTSPNLTRLETLDLSSLIPQPRTWLGGALAWEIVRAGLPPTLRRLRLHSNHFTPSVVAELVRQEHMAQLTELDLILNTVGSVGAEALAQSPYTKSLEYLRLYKTELDDSAARALAASAHLRPFHLNVANNAIGPEGMTALAQSSVLSRILTVGLHENPLGDEGARHLARATWLSRLVHLELAHCRVGSDGVEALASAPGLGGLVSLGLRSNHAGNEGVIALANSPHVTRLRQLDLRDTRIEDAGALALARSPHLNNLRNLQLSQNRIGQQALDELRERFGPGLVFEPRQG